MRCELLTESSEISFVGAAKIQSPSATAPVRAMLGLVSTVPPASSVGALSALVAAAMRTIMVTNCARVSLFDGDSLAAEVPFTTPWLIRAAAACFCSVVMEEVSVKLLSSSVAVSARSYANARAISTKASARVAAVSKLRLSFAVIRPRWMALPRSSLYHADCWLAARPDTLSACVAPSARLRITIASERLTELFGIILPLMPFRRPSSTPLRNEAAAQ